MSNREKETLEYALCYLRELRSTWDWKANTIDRSKREIEELDTVIKRMKDLVEDS